MVGCCRWCGAEQETTPFGSVVGVYGGADLRCWDCKLAPDVEVPVLPPGRPEEEIGYELGDWPAHARVMVGTTLSDRGIAWRWEPGLALVVRESDEAAVEELLDELEDEELAGTGDEASDGDDADSDQQAAEEDAQAAMGDLFVAADRLMHEPWDEAVAEDLLEAAGVVAEGPPPYGMDADIWVQIQELAKMVCNDLDAAGDEVVAQDARALRQVLRRYV